MAAFDEGGIIYAPSGPGVGVFIDGHRAHLVRNDSLEPEWILTAEESASLLRRFNEES